VSRTPAETMVGPLACGRTIRWLWRLAGVAVSLPLAACAGSVGLAGDMQPAELRSAPEAVELTGITLRLETYLWRDFMPISPPDGRPLSAVLRILAEGGRPLPAGLRADRLWVVNGTEVWTTELGAPRPADPSRPDRLEYLARGGPKWAPDSRVEVVVRVLDSGGTVHLLRASGQRIKRTS
jgi:hypothetical protein